MLVRRLAGEVEALAGAGEVHVRVDAEDRETGRIQPARRDAAQHAAVGEARALIGGVALPARVGLHQLIVADVRERVAAGVDALREVAAPLEGGRHAGPAVGIVLDAPLVLLAEEEEQLLLLLVEAREEDRAADGVAGVVARGLGQRDLRLDALVEPGVGVPVRAPPVPVAGSVEVARAALGDHLHLRADGAAVLGLVGVREDLELGDGVDVGRRHVAAVVAGVDVGDAVDRHVVGVRPLAVHRESCDCPRFRPPCLRERTGHARREVEEHPPVVGDVRERLVLERERALAAGRLQLADAARDRDFLGHRADVAAQGAGREAIVGVDDEVGPLQRLEALEADLEGVGVRPHDREDEPTLGVRHRGQDVALGAAGQRDGHARQHPPWASAPCPRRRRSSFALGRALDRPRRQAHDGRPTTARSLLSKDITLLLDLYGYFDPEGQMVRSRAYRPTRAGSQCEVDTMPRIASTTYDWGKFALRSRGRHVLATVDRSMRRMGSNVRNRAGVRRRLISPSTASAARARRDASDSSAAAARARRCPRGDRPAARWILASVT